MRRDEERVEIRDEAPEWHWWTRLPNIVLEKIENPFEGWLLLVIRKVAGDDLKNGCPVGVCSMSQRKLAEVANMSRTQVSRTMHALLQKGLIEGELKKAEDGEGWPVWHITIPRSLWEENETVYWERKEEREAAKSVPPESQEAKVSPPGTVSAKSVPVVRTTKNQSFKNISPLSKDKGGEPSPDLSHEKTRHPPRLSNGPLKKAMVMLRERCKARGYSLERSAASRDAKDLKGMLEEGYTLEDIFACYDSKVTEPRFQERHLPMRYVREDIPVWLAAKGGNGKRPPGDRYRPQATRGSPPVDVPERCEGCGQYMPWCVCEEEKQEPTLAQEGAT